MVFYYAKKVKYLTSREYELELKKIKAQNRQIEMKRNLKAAKTYADAFFKTGGSYAGTCFRTLASGARGGISRTWVLVNSSEVSGTSATDAKTSTECYATIAAAGTALHKQAYSSIVSGTDSGTASYANSAGSANSVAWGNVTGKPSTFAPSSHTHNYAGLLLQWLELHQLRKEVWIYG